MYPNLSLKYKCFPFAMGVHQIPQGADTISMLALPEPGMNLCWPSKLEICQTNAKHNVYIYIISLLIYHYCLTFITYDIHIHI